MHSWCTIQQARTHNIQFRCRLAFVRTCVCVCVPPFVCSVIIAAIVVALFLFYHFTMAPKLVCSWDSNAGGLGVCKPRAQKRLRFSFSCIAFRQPIAAAVPVAGADQHSLGRSARFIRHFAVQFTRIAANNNGNNNNISHEASTCMRFKIHKIESCESKRIQSECSRNNNNRMLNVATRSTIQAYWEMSPKPTLTTIYDSK